MAVVAMPEGALMARTQPKAKASRRHERCEPMSRILVAALAPGTKPAGVACSSSTDFLVHCSTNSATPPSGYTVGVKSTGFTTGSAAPTFVVGGIANDVVTIRMMPGTVGFITLQTQCGAKAAITPVA